MPESSQSFTNDEDLASNEVFSKVKRVQTAKSDTESQMSVFQKFSFHWSLKKINKCILTKV